MKHILVLLLAAMFPLSVLAGCGNGGSAETTVETTEEPETFVTTALIQGGASDFVIVHEGTQETRTLANEVRNAIATSFGVTLNVGSSREIAEGGKEIVIGNARQIAEKTMKKLTGAFDFALKVEENQLVLCAKDAASYLYLKEYLKREVFVKPESGDLVLDSDDNIIYSRSALMEKNYIDYCQEQDVFFSIDNLFAFDQYKNDDTVLPYRIYVPSNYSPDKTYPLFINLHGAGHRGNDNIKQLRFVEPLMKNAELSIDDMIVIVPQCPEDNRWVDTEWGNGTYTLENTPESNELKALIELIGQLQQTYSVDAKRIYACGFSMGGYATWNLLMNHPDLFCAGVAMCGAADTAQAANLAKIPVWAVHGVKDPTVPVQGSRDIVEAIQAAGGTLIKYTEYPDHEHDVWTDTYNNTEVFTWLFEQVKE